MSTNVAGTRPFKIVLLNALVPPEFDGIIVVNHITLNGAKEVIRIAEGKIESYIGHESTATFLSNALGINVPVNRGMYIPKDGDVALVFRLKKRLERPEDLKNVSESDIEVLLITYRAKSSLPSP